MYWSVTCEISLSMSLQISVRQTIRLEVLKRISSKDKCKPKYRTDFMAFGFPAHVAMSSHSGVN